MGVEKRGGKTREGIKEAGHKLFQVESSILLLALQNNNSVLKIINIWETVT